MPSDPLILGFDTSAAHCAAALLCGDNVVATCFKEMGRGQAEHLMPLIEDMLSEAQVTWKDLNAIGVGVGPGNFTGIRISVSAARGLALALNIPAVGVSSFEAIESAATHIGVPCVPGPRGQGYLAPKGAAPYLASADELADTMQDVAILTPDYPNIAEHIARVALLKHSIADLPAPAPLYIKAADAAPPRDPAPVILDDDA